MAFKSEAHRRKIHELEKQGKLKPGTAASWESETPKGPLPKRIHPPKVATPYRGKKK